MPEPRTSICTVLVTRTSLAAARAATRAPTCTAILCVPKIPSVSGDVRVLVDDTADRIASAASESVEVNEGGRRFEWCGLAEGAVWPVLVVVGLVLSQHPQ